MESTNLHQDEILNKSSRENNKNLFSFKGRMRRRTYWIISLIYGFLMVGLEEATANGFEEGGVLILLLILVPAMWIMLATYAKRCHDLGHSGWWMFIPFYSLWMAFQNSEPGDNEYGPNPKGE